METILEGREVFEAGMNDMAIGWRVWIYWMMFINIIALPFAFTRSEARVILVAFFLAAVFMMWLAGAYGYERILGLAHVVFWTPLVIYLIARYRNGDVPRTSLYGRYVLVVILTNTASLVIDYVDVARYLLGERSGA